MYFTRRWSVCQILFLLASLAWAVQGYQASTGSYSGQWKTQGDDPRSSTYVHSSTELEQSHQPGERQAANPQSIDVFAMFLLACLNPAVGWQTAVHQPHLGTIPCSRADLAMSAGRSHFGMQATRRSVLGMAFATAVSLLPRPALAWTQYSYLGDGIMYEGIYSDPEHPGGKVTITMITEPDKDGVRSAMVAGGGGKGQPEQWSIEATVTRDKSIEIDLTNIGGKKMKGVGVEDTKKDEYGIQWNGKTVWKLEGDLPDAARKEAERQQAVLARTKATLAKVAVDEDTREIVESRKSGKAFSKDEYGVYR